jgi:hypothetical protein
MSVVAFASERADRVRMLAALAEVFGEDLGDTRLEAYLLALQDVPLAALRTGCQQVIRASTWFPKPAELRRAVDAALASQRLLETAQQQVVRDDDWRVAHHCQLCADSGLAYVRKRDGATVPHSQVTGSHADWGVRPCMCRERNPVIAQRCGPRAYGVEK